MLPELTLAVLADDPHCGLLNVARNCWATAPLLCLCPAVPRRRAADGGVPCCDAHASGIAPLLTCLTGNEHAPSVKALAECRRLAGLADSGETLC